MADEDETVRGAAALARLDGDLGALGRGSGSPFLTPEWLRAWWEAFGAGEPLALAVRRGGEVVGGAFCRRRGPAVSGTANDHSGDWDVFAVDAEARAQAWRSLAGLGALRAHLPAVPAWTGSADVAQSALAAAGYRVVREPAAPSPFLRLPSSWDELIAAASRNLRSQVGRRRRALEREGRVTFRTSSEVAEVARDLDAFLAVEASGWKGRGGTAILADPRTATLYRTFALESARSGFGRLHLLEVDGVAIAADLEVVLQGVAFLIKTGYDERWGRLSPGLVLRAEVLRRAIDDGLTGYDFLGGPDPYKLRWTSDGRERVRLAAYRDPPGYWYRARLRPALKSLRGRVRAVGE